MNNSTFKNPYYESDKAARDLKRMIFEVSASDFMFIRLVRPANSTLSGVNGTMWKKLVETLKQRNIDDATRVTEFEHFVTTSRLVSADEYTRLVGAGLLDSPIGGTVRNTAPPNVGGTETPTRDQHPANATVVPDVQSKGGKPPKRERLKGQSAS